MMVRLTRKLADCIDGVDLSRRRVGDVFNVSRRAAQLLMAEGWAEAEWAGAERRLLRFDRRKRAGSSVGLAQAADRASHTRQALERLSYIRERLTHRWLVETNHRRLEDDIRDELRDAREQVVACD